ncbi:hypothetical protein, partial [Brucella melitensis]|uniref:hypothetical protein n=1 Tax=Brucella melitensis TaxID=29459 RepID=UPI003B6855CC
KEKKRFAAVLIPGETSGGKEIHHGGVRRTQKERLKNLLRPCVHKHERLESLRATEQGPPTANCTGLHKALADGTPERRAKGS